MKCQKGWEKVINKRRETDGNAQIVPSDAHARLDGDFRKFLKVSSVVKHEEGYVRTFQSDST